MRASLGEDVSGTVHMASQRRELGRTHHLLDWQKTAPAGHRGHTLKRAGVWPTEHTAPEDCGARWNTRLLWWGEIAGVSSTLLVTGFAELPMSIYLHCPASHLGGSCTKALRDTRGSWFQCPCPSPVLASPR
jgi:hypothetical protein